jgi:hypothetical protein
MPVWSSDGSFFVISGQVLMPNGQVEFELYRVNRDGKIDQLTHLSAIGILKGVIYSLSPYGQKIAMYLDTWYDTKESRVAILDMKTHEITDYCIPIRGIPDQTPVWSPDSVQFLVTDQHNVDHRSVILVDITKGLAVKIADDMEPVGWMLNP